MKAAKKFKLAVLTTHPIEFQAPLFKRIAAEENIDLTVYFCWDFGVKETYDEGFGTKIKWDMPYLEGYKYVFLKNYARRPTSGRFFGCINPGIVPALWQGNYDAVWVLGWQVFSMWLTILAGWILRIPVFLRGENPLNQEWTKPPLKRSLKKAILGTLFKFVRIFFYITEENKKFYQYYGIRNESKLIFMPYAVDNDWLIQERKNLLPRWEEIRNRIGIPQDAITFLFVGKLIPKKRPMDTLRAYELCLKRLPADAVTALLYVGDGALRPEIEEFVKANNVPNVFITGFLNPSKIPEYYVASDVYVQASGVGDTAPMTVNEAMCFKLPILISDLIGSARDRVLPGENGYIFPYTDSDTLANYMLEMVSDKQKVKKFGERSLDLIQECSFERDVAALQSAINKISYN